MTDERRTRLLALACELVERVREVDPARNATWLESIRDDWRDLLIVIAAMVDPVDPLSKTLAWTDGLVVPGDQ